MALILPNTIANDQDADGNKLQQNFAALQSHINNEVITSDGSTGMENPLLLSGAPTQPNQAATKGYVDSAIAPLATKVYVDTTVLPATKSYVDSKVPLTQYGSQTIQVNGFGDVVIVFPTPFKAGTIPNVQLTQGWHGAAHIVLSIQSDLGVSAGSFGLRAWDTIANAAVNAGFVAVSWLAVGVAP